MAFVCRVKVDLARTRKNLQKNHHSFSKSFPSLTRLRCFSNKKPNFEFPEENVTDRMSQLDYDVFFRKMFGALDMEFESLSQSPTEQIIRNFW